ncbi:MAG: accessory gene regulator B family protein [bacterium]|nr:accessory gene regulator B family protein [bacterium]
MKKKFLSKSLKLIVNNKPNMTEEELATIKYGLESMYINISKIIIIVLLATTLNLLIPTLLVMLAYNIIRSTSFGLHATKSIYCLISSILLFIGGAYICLNLTIPIYIETIICILCFICIYLYAPADTQNRPLINIKKRKRYKTISIISVVLYTIIILIDNSIISNYLLIGLVEASILIHPLVYKIFNLPFDNYKNYQYN